MLSSAHKINVAQLLVAAGQVADIKIDRIVPGPIHIDRLSLQGISADLKSAKAFLKSVRLLLELQFSVDWWYNIGIWSDSGSDDLGKIFFPLPVGDVEVPSLSNILLNIPDVSATNVTATIGPIVNFDLGGGAFTGVSATNAAIPTNGFQLSGLGVVSASIGNVGIPQTLVDNVRIQDFSPSGNIVYRMSSCRDFSCHWRASAMSRARPPSPSTLKRLRADCAFASATSAASPFG